MSKSNDTQQESEPALESTQDSPNPQNGRRRPRKRTILRLAIGLGIIAAVIAIHYYLHAVSHESTDDAFLDSSIVSISPRVSGHVAKVYVTDNQKVAAGDLLLEIDPRDFQARLDAARASLQADEAANRSRSIDVDLTSTSSTAGLDEANAAVAAAQAMVQNAAALAAAAESRQGEAQAQVAFAKAALGQAQAEIQAVEAKHEQASHDLKRFEEMAQSNTISPQQLDHAVTAERMAAAEYKAARSKVDTQQSMLQQAAAALKAARDNVNQARAQLAARRAQAEQATARLTSARSAPAQVAKSSSQAEESKADVEKSRAEVEQAELNLSYTRIRAPMDGYVTKKSVDPGAYVQQGQSLMAIVAPQVWVTANFKETQLTHMRPGLPVTISVDTYPDAVLHGHVDSIQRGTGSRFSLLPPENATGNFVKVVQRIPVKIVFDEPEELAKYLLVPGMSVVPEVDIRADIPQAASGKTAEKTDTRSAAP